MLILGRGFGLDLVVGVGLHLGHGVGLGIFLVLGQVLGFVLGLEVVSSEQSTFKRIKLVSYINNSSFDNKKPIMSM